MSRSNGGSPKKRTYHHGDLKNALITAGADLLSEQGVAALSLRKVALRAGVSHAAPYAHFADKQALIAAISTEGYRRLYQAISTAALDNEGDPVAQLIEGAWAYVKFALEDTHHFKVAMSGIVEKEHDYPAFIEMSQRSFALLLSVVELCQKQGIVRPGPTDVVAVSLWSLVHGLVSLLLENQIPGAVRKRRPDRQLLIAMLNQVTCIDLNEHRPRLKRVRRVGASQSGENSRPSRQLRARARARSKQGDASGGEP